MLVGRLNLRPVAILVVFTASPWFLRCVSASHNATVYIDAEAFALLGGSLSAKDLTYRSMVTASALGRAMGALARGGLPLDNPIRPRRIPRRLGSMPHDFTCSLSFVSCLGAASWASLTPADRVAPWPDMGQLARLPAPALGSTRTPAGSVCPEFPAISPARLPHLSIVANVQGRNRWAGRQAQTLDEALATLIARRLVRHGMLSPTHAETHHNPAAPKRVNKAPA